MRFVWPKQLARMRFEGEDDGRHAACAGFGQGTLQHGLMTAMDPIEIADGNDSTAKGRR